MQRYAQEGANTDKSRYIATDEIQLQIGTVLEKDFRIIGTDDYTAREQLKAGWQALTLKKGYGCRYRITAGEAWSLNTAEWNCSIIPTCFWVSEDGTERKEAFLCLDTGKLQDCLSGIQCEKADNQGKTVLEWTGNFVLPERVHVITSENRAEYLKCAENQIFDGTEELFEQKGFLMIHFDITFEDGSGNKYPFTVWENTELAEDAKELGWEYVPGDVIRYDLSKGISEDYELGNLE